MEGSSISHDAPESAAAVPAGGSGAASRIRLASARATYRRIERALFRPRPNDGSVAIALLMVVVSIAAGPVTYLVTNHASRATEIEDGRLHDAVELGYLQRTIQARLEHDHRTFIAYARRDAAYRARAEGAVAAAPGVDHEFAKQAEREQLLAVFGQFEWGVPERDDDGVPRYPTERARATLEEQLEGGRLRELEGSAASATDRAQAERRTALWLVGLILALVGALLLFTGAQVTPRRWRRTFASLGTLVALAAVVGVVVVDTTVVAWGIAIGTVLAFALIGLGERLAPTLRRLLKRRLRAHASSDLVTNDTGARGPTMFTIPDPREMGTLFSRAVALTIAVATLCGAWIGLLQADAFGRSDEWGFVAQQHALQASNAGEQAENDVLFAVGAYGAATDAVVKVWAAEALVRYLPESASDDARRTAEAALAEARAIAVSMEELGKVEAGDFGPSADSTFPIGWTADASREHDRLTALQWLADADSREWEGRGNFYVRWLVVLAIAVYLLGLAVVIPGEGVKVIFLAAGASGVVFAAAVGFWTLVDQPRSAVEGAAVRASSAAAAYADGRFRMATGDLDGAVTAFHLAVDRRPDFGQAFARLASATYLSGSTQTEDYVSVSSPEAVREAIAHYEEAERNGHDGFGVQASLGWERLLLSLQTTDPARRRELLGASLRASTGATVRVPDNPVPYFNIALARLVEGNEAAANSAYADAIRLTRGVVDDPALVDRLSLLGASLTDLELLRLFRPDLAGVADRNEARLIRELSGAQPLNGEGIGSSEVETGLLPTALSWSGRLAGLDTTTDTVTQVWFHRARASDPWTTYGDVETLDLEAKRASGSAVFLQAPDSRYMSKIDVPARSAGCVSDGQYRVDIYVNGVLAARSVEMTRVNSDSPDVGAVGWWARDIGLLACIPPAWRPVTGSDHQPGHVDAVTSPDLSSGLVFARIRYGDALIGLGAADALLDSIRRSGLSVIPAGLERDRRSDRNSSVIGSGGGRTQVWRAPGSEYRAQAGMTEHGTVLVAILFGPTGFLATDDARIGPIGASYVQMDEVWGIRRPTTR